MKLEKVSMAALVDKLAAIGGPSPLKQREWRIRVRLNWHHKAKSAVRHMLYGARQPTYQEAREIEAAHLKFCAERIRQNAAENEALLSSMRSAVAAMEACDPAFFEPHLLAMREILLQRRSQAAEGEGLD
jgi:hypothetical protein